MRFGVALTVLAAALGGCMQDDQIVQPLPTAATSPELPGIRVTGQVFDSFVGAPSDGRHRLVATAENDGPASYRVESLCSSPWSERFLDDQGATFEAREPVFHCLAFQLGDFPPGGKLSFEGWWNETRWNSSQEQLEPVPQGDYTWELSFTARATDEAEPKSIVLPFRVGVEG